ncbi:MAG: hypothetical protein Tsb002_09220 [Wenzhouxiangellaceae bacterium]
MQGFLLDYSEALVLLAYVYDFTVDGMVVLRRSDITQMGSDATDRFQTQILKDEGIYSRVNFSPDCDLTDWGSVFSTLGSSHHFLIVEDESPEYPLFVLGELRHIGSDSVKLLGFSGAANWDDEVTEVYYEDISCMQLGNNYARAYERYFERNGLTE